MWCCSPSLFTHFSSGSCLFQELLSNNLGGQLSAYPLAAWSVCSQETKKKIKIQLETPKDSSQSDIIFHSIFSSSNISLLKCGSKGKQVGERKRRIDRNSDSQTTSLSALLHITISNSPLSYIEKLFNVRQLDSRLKATLRQHSVCV